MKLLQVARMGLLSFVLGCFSNTGPYNKKDGSWFWKKDRMGVDPASFATFGSYAKDARGEFLNGVRVRK